MSELPQEWEKRASPNSQIGLRKNIGTSKKPKTKGKGEGRKYDKTKMKAKENKSSFLKHDIET